jgi:hypothetical protein
MSGVCAVAESADEELRKKVEGKVPHGRQCVVVFVEASTPHTCKLHDDEDGSFFREENAISYSVYSWLHEDIFFEFFKTSKFDFFMFEKQGSRKLGS